MDAAATSSGKAQPVHAAEEEVPELPGALLLDVLQHLPPNEVACTARLVCKEVAQRFSSPQHRTVRLSRPLPPHAVGLVRCWEGELPRLPFAGKLQLLSAAAASGCETNLAVAWALVRSCLVLEAPPECYISSFGTASPDPGTAAATRGHGHLLPWLLEHRCPLDPARTLEAVAEHCDLAALRWAWVQLVQHRPECVSAGAEAAARSATPDALGKLEWLLSLPGCALSSHLAAGAAWRGDLRRLQWLRDRGVRPGTRALEAALASPAAGVEVVGWLERQGAGSVAYAWHCTPGRVSPNKLAWAASRPGVEVTHEQWELACVRAARAGDLPAVAHLHGARGEGLTEGVWCAAAESGSMELLSWLRDRGCPAHPDAVRAAARSGSVECFDWLLRHGGNERLPAPGVVIACWDNPDGSAKGAVRAPAAAPWAGGGSGGDPDLLRAVRLLVGAGAVVEGSEALDAAARRGDLPLVQLLASLGGTCDESLLEAAAEGGCEALLHWLVARGCPVERAPRAYVAAVQCGNAGMLRALQQAGLPCGDEVVRAVRKAFSPALVEALGAALAGWSGRLL